MCLILFAWRAHPDYPLIVAANRDEFHDRPTDAAAFWAGEDDILAGRDRREGGTWLGITRSGRFGAVSNYAEPGVESTGNDKSRGHLVSDYLRGSGAPDDFARERHPEAGEYRGFNLLLADRRSMVYLSNRQPAAESVPGGIHGLSNHLLDTSWPKVVTGRQRLQALLGNREIDPEALIALLADRSVLPGERMPEVEMDARLAMVTRRLFIVSPDYGTRSSTALVVDRHGEVRFVERRYDSRGAEEGTASYGFRLEASRPG